MSIENIIRELRSAKDHIESQIAEAEDAVRTHAERAMDARRRLAGVEEDIAKLTPLLDQHILGPDEIIQRGDEWQPTKAHPDAWAPCVGAGVVGVRAGAYGETFRFRGGPRTLETAKTVTVSPGPMPPTRTELRKALRDVVQAKPEEPAEG